MSDTAVVNQQNYSSIIDRQHKRILELEADLARSSNKIRMLKSRAVENHNATVAAIAAQTNGYDYARAHAAHVQAMLAMSAAAATNPHLTSPAQIQMLPTSPRLAGPLAPPSTPNTFPRTGEEDERAGKTRYWTEMEHNQFLYAVKLFGPKNYVAISQFVGTRTPKQVRTHAQKYQMKLEREAKKRRAQAAAVAAVSAPGAAAAAAAAIAAVEQRIHHSLPHTFQGIHTIPGIPPHHAAAAIHAATIPGIQHFPGIPTIPMNINPIHNQIVRQQQQKVAQTHVNMQKNKRNGRKDSDAAQSTSTCPTVEDGSNGGDIQSEAIQETALSPISNDSVPATASAMIDDEKKKSNIDVIMQTTTPPPVPLYPGLKKNASLGNLADYDDFMRRFTNAVEHRPENTQMFDSDSNDLDMDLLETDGKTEQFDDSLLADLED